MTDPRFYRRRGTASRVHTLVPPVESQQVERYQAHDAPAVWGANPPLNWRRSLPILGLFAVICGGMFVPFPVQVALGLTLVLVAMVAAYRVTR
jgi:hypothetical protein